MNTEGISRDILCFRVIMCYYNRSEKEELSWLREAALVASEAGVWPPKIVQWVPAFPSKTHPGRLQGQHWPNPAWQKLWGHSSGTPTCPGCPAWGRLLASFSQLCLKQNRSTSHFSSYSKTIWREKFKGKTLSDRSCCNQHGIRDKRWK